MEVYYIVVFFILGTIMASFFNVVGSRRANGQSIVSPRSHCTKCGHVLKPIELIPIFSFLIQGWKCKACKTKRRIFILRANEMLHTILSLPTASIGDFSKYIMRLVSKGKKSNQVVTKFSLKKVQNAGGITYSKVVLATERDLNEEEMKNIAKMTEQVKAIASNLQENYESEE